MNRFAIMAASALALVATLPARAQTPRVLSDAIHDLAGQIAESMAKEKKGRVAVLPFSDLEGRATVMGKFLSEELSTHLFRANIAQIVERNMLGKVLGETSLWSSGAIDPKTVREVGKVAGVDAIVTGSFLVLNDVVAVNGRLLDTETGMIFAAAQVKIVRDGNIDKLLALHESAGASTQTLVPDSGGRPVPKSLQSAQAKEFAFDLQECKASGAELVCKFLVTNRGGDRELWLNRDSRLFDDHGNQIYVSRVRLANREGRVGYGGVEMRLISGVPTPMLLFFQGLPEEARSISSLEISCGAQGGFWVNLRNIPITR